MLPELQKLGFTRNEANVYFTALKLGRCSVQQLANATGLNRITVHSIVEKFEGLQIFLRTYEGKRRRIQAVDPQRLQLLLEKEESILQEKQDALMGILPGLQELFRHRKRGLQITTFEGEEGYVQICEDVLNTGEDMLEFANIDALNAVIGPYIAKDYLPRKREIGIHTHFLLVDTPDARSYIQREYVDNPEASPMEAKFIDQTEFPLDAFFVIYGTKLTILTPETLEGVIIDDKAITDSLRPFYNFVWARAGKSVCN